ncbi:MAG: protein kinase [Phycisphaerales bacterium]|nr:protein kinase [Phycisphaerales bacterium]
MTPKDRHPRPETNTPTIRLGNVTDEGLDLPPHLRLEPGDEVGHYKIVSLVAEGGFGIVYLAEQYSPVRRRVALKIIKPGMDTLAVITRFEAERQALAILDHPGIATVYDAGATDDGRPYFVMEYVEGDPITEYCDDHRLDTTQRLQLMIDVCAAVQHAHMKGIIHRDLKPSNILVSTDSEGRPQPKVIDFGVAKATSVELTERSFCTESGQLIGTPEYMSPEQADLGSADVDTRSDVYSLGMILYEIVSGALPFESIAMRQAGFSELCRIIQEDEPPKPSTRLVSLGGEASKVATRRQARPAELATMLRRELDWIPLKALRKERDERYESAASMAEDINRYLTGDVLMAGPETSRYRLRKFLRRNRGGVLAAGFVFVAMLAGLYVSLLLLDRAWKSEDRLVLELDRKSQMEETLSKQVNQLEEKEALNKATKEELAERIAELEQAKVDIQRIGYVSNLLAAATALDAGDASDARRLLLMAADGRDGELPFEWRYLWAQAETSLAVLGQPGERNIRAVIDPDGESIYTFSPERFARWNPMTIPGEITSTPLVSVETPGRNPREALVSPDGRSALLGAANGQRDLIETSTGRVLDMLPAVEPGRPPFVYSEDGRRFAYGNDDRTLRIQSSQTARTISEVTLPEGVEQVAIDNTASRIAAISRDRVHLLNAASGEPVVQPLGHDLLDVTAATFDRPALRLATATMDGQVRIWDVQTGRMTSTFTAPIRSIETIRFGPNENLMHLRNARGTDIFVNMQDGQVVAEPTGAWSMTPDWSLLASGDGPLRMRIDTLRGNEPPRRITVDSPTATALTDDGQQLLAADSGGNVYLWDLTQAEPVATRVGHHDTTVTQVDFVGNGSRILSVARGGPRLWPITGRSRIDHLPLDEHPPTRLVFAPTMPHLVIGSATGMIVVADLSTGQTIAMLDGHNGEVVDLQISHDGQRLLSTARDNTVKLWDLMSGRELFSTERSWWSETPIALDPTTGLVMLPGQGNAYILVDMETGTLQATLSGHDAAVSAMAFDPSGTRVVTGDTAGEVRLWNTSSGAVESRLRGHDGPIASIAFTPDGSRVVSGSADTTIRIWNARNGQEIDDLQIIAGNPIESMSLSPDGQHIAAGMANGTVRAWSLASGDRVTSLDGGNTTARSITFSPDGGVLVSEGDDGSLRTWNTTTWQPGADLGGSVADYQTRDLDSATTRIATGQGNQGIRIHDARTGEAMYTLRGHDTDVTLVAFSPAGDRLVSSDSDGNLLIWNTQTSGQADAARQLMLDAHARFRPMVEQWAMTTNNDPDQLVEMAETEIATRPADDGNVIRTLVLMHLLEEEQSDGMPSE